MKYLGIKPVSGKWYVSEGFISKTNPTRDDIAQMNKHNKAADKTIIDGPFDSEDEAQKAAKNLEREPTPYI